MIGNFLGIFEKPHSYVKTEVATFWATFGNIWANFYYNIRSVKIASKRVRFGSRQKGQCFV